jgi:hypothetical protein
MGNDFGEKNISYVGGSSFHLCFTLQLKRRPEGRDMMDAAVGKEKQMTKVIL